MNGIIPVWKERGMTSHDVVARLRRILHEKKIGHTGTLDPDVAGVLVCCVGEGTKLVSLITEKIKEYSGEITLGFQTDTEDASGQVLKTQPLIERIPDSSIKTAMEQLTGEITQIPPMYSAVKVNGRRLYDYARHGETVERPERQVTVNQFEILRASTFDEKQGYQNLSFQVICGKGTYVRTLATDLGKILGVPATMTELTRDAVRPFTTQDSMTLDEIERRVSEDDTSFIYPPEYVLQDYPIWNVPTPLIRLVNNGAVLHRTQLPEKLPVRAYVGNHLKAIYDVHPRKNSEAKPIKVFR